MGSLASGVVCAARQDRRDSELNAVRQLQKQLAPAAQLCQENSLTVSGHGASCWRQEKGLVASFSAAAAAAEKKAEAAAVKLKEAEARKQWNSAT